ncbi:hypothetical protein C3L33_03644, partial [Rhododendron williamsianum]
MDKKSHSSEERNELSSDKFRVNKGGEDKQTEEYISELNVLSCYDFIEQSCVHILKQLSAMQKQRSVQIIVVLLDTLHLVSVCSDSVECPEECREAVGSLMFAAARFSDFPELRDLRDTFQERYGSSLEHFVNQDFVKNLASRPPTTEKKIKLLHDIALEFSIKWDSRGFEKRMANPSASCQGQPKKYGPFHDHEDKDKFPKDTETVTKIDKQSHSSKERNEISSDKYRVNKGGEVNLLKREDLDHRHFRKKSQLQEKRQLKGLHILLKDEHHRKYEDERVIDNLLLHYSTKTSNYDQETARRKSKKASNGPNNVQDEMGLHPTRCVSLPREQIDPAEPSVKVYTRANSFQPDKPAGHVHPKLPDYDDLAAQLAALRGR